MAITFQQHAVGMALALAVAACSAGCGEYDEPPQVPQLTVNLYESAPGAQDPQPDGEAVAEAPSRPAWSSGIPACDAYFRRAERCAEAITSSPHALARFMHAVDVARKEDRIIARSTDARAKHEAAARCEAALHAYETAPCGA